jgi:hypothetical protein
VVDKFIKIAWYLFIRKIINAIELIDLFINYIFKDFKCPKGITSDKGLIFISKF